MAGKFMSLGVEGREAVNRALSGTRTADAKRISKKVFYRVASGARDDLRNKAPRRKGALRKAIKARTTRGGGAAVVVDKSRAPHWYVSGEGGTKDRKTKSGAGRGRVVKKPWIAPVRERLHKEFPAIATEIARELRSCFRLSGKD